jgi:hypothetical protein
MHDFGEMKPIKEWRDMHDNKCLWGRRDGIAGDSVYVLQYSFEQTVRDLDDAWSSPSGSRSCSDGYWNNHVVVFLPAAVIGWIMTRCLRTRSSWRQNPNDHFSRPQTGTPQPIILASRPNPRHQKIQIDQKVASSRTSCCHH